MRPPWGGGWGGLLYPPARSRLRATPLLVDLHLVLDAVVQLKVVVLQGGGGAGGQAAVGAGAVEQHAGAHGAQHHAQGAHHDDGEQDGVQGVQPGVVLVLLRHQGHRGRVRRRRGGRGGRPSRKDVAWEGGGDGLTFGTWCLAEGSIPLKLEWIHFNIVFNNLLEAAFCESRQTDVNHVVSSVSLVSNQTQVLVHSQLLASIGTAIYQNIYRACCNCSTKWID